MPLLQTYTRPHPRRLSRFMAVVAAASIALAGATATPARADKTDTLRTAAQIAGILIIGKLIADSNKKRRLERAQARQPQTPPRVIADTLPLQCVRWVDTDRGARRILGKDCIERRLGRVALPRRCEQRYWDANGYSRIGYNRRCLINKGYRIEPVSRW